MPDDIIALDANLNVIRTIRDNNPYYYSVSKYEAKIILCLPAVCI